MPLIAPKLESKGPKFTIPVGTNMARCIGLVHIGTITESYPGKEPMQMNKIRLTFEFPAEMHVFKEGEEAKPLVLSGEYNLSMFKKSKLRPIVEGIIGTTLEDQEADGFNIEEVVGKSCLVNVKMNKKGTYPEIASTSPLMKGQIAPRPINKSKILTYEKWDQTYFDSLPDFIKDKMKKSKEFTAMKYPVDDGSVFPDIDPDSIPL